MELLGRKLVCMVVFVDFCRIKFTEMQLEPSDLYEKLEFDKVLELLENECVGLLGKQAVQKTRLMAGFSWLSQSSQYGWRC